MEELKKRVGHEAVKYIKSNMTVGLGTGSTAYWFIDELGKKIQEGTLTNIRAVPTSTRSKEQAKELGIPLVELDQVDHIDVLVDGADECTLKHFEGIKGGGGALLHEKIVAQNSHQIIWILDESKIVKELGAFPLPIEVIPFGSWRLFKKLEQAGFHPAFRMTEDDSLFITDSGNYIIDLHLKSIPYPPQLAHELKSAVGIVEHGLFLNYADVVLVGRSNGNIQTFTKETNTPQ